MAYKNKNPIEITDKGPLYLAKELSDWLAGVDSLADGVVGVWFFRRSKVDLRESA
jgi:hypothetical protein